MSKPQSMLFHQNSQYSRVMNLKYKSKYKKIKRQIKNFVFENAALCDEVAQVQGDLVKAREERRYLIKRLIRHEGLEALHEQQNPNEEEHTAADVASTKPPSIPKKRGPKKRIPNTATPTATAKTIITKTDKQPKVRAPRQRMTRDADGKLAYPINLSGTLMLHMPGEIISENYNFHTPHWIFPVGYVATRIYAHPKDPMRKCVFTCKILNNIGMPQFQIIPDNDFDSVFFGETANLCHQGLLEALQRSWPDVGAPLPLHTQGERFFGLGNPTVRSLIQADPNFERCARFKGFLVDGGYGNDEKDPTLNFDALQSLFSISDYHTVPQVKDEPPDELLEQRMELIN